MQNVIKEYPLFTLYDLTLEPFEVREFFAAGADQCFGSIYISGNIAPVGEDSGPLILNHREYRERKDWGVKDIWEDPEGRASFMASDVGARWFCLAQAPIYDGLTVIGYRPKPEVVKESVEVRTTVKEGWGALICWTEADVVLVDDQQALTSQLVDPRNEGFDVTGTCDLLLFRKSDVA